MNQGPLVIPVMRPALPKFDQVVPYLKAMDETRVYSNRGPLVRDLESRYASFFKVDPSSVVSVSSATQGITGAVAVSSREKWIVPDWTFAATAHAVSNARAEVVLKDVESGTGSIHDHWEEYPSSFGILPVVPFGMPLEVDRLVMSQEFVVDAAASIGCQPTLEKLPDNGAVVFSLHATKVLGGGEGGIVVFGSPERAREFRSWTNFGFQGSRSASRLGTNAKMSESTAAYCLASLDAWGTERDSWLRVRRRVAEISRSLDLDTWLLPADVVSPYWLVLCESAGHLVSLSEKLNQSGIGNRRWWPQALHEMEAFGECERWANESGATSRDLASRVVGLPFFRDMGHKDFETIRQTIQSLLTR